MTPIADCGVEQARTLDLAEPRGRALFLELVARCDCVIENYRADVLDRLGDRWTLLVLMELQSETLRFSAIKKRITDISPRMLAQTLRQLEYDGLIARKDVYSSSHAPRVLE